MPLDPGTAFRFSVTIDGTDLGAFTSCEGLAAEYEIEPYHEGGENAYEHRLPGRLKYPNIKLSRPVDAKSAGPGSLAVWFSRIHQLGGKTGSTKTASITAFDADGEVIARWSLLGAYPCRWTGPNFSADGNMTVKETLELAHHGFLDGSAER
jgi:phage tail-like protein